MRRASDPLTPLEAGVAAFGLPGSEIPSRRTGGQEWKSFVERISQARLEGLLVAAAEAGALPASDAHLADVRELGRARARVDLELEREALRAAVRLESGGVPFRLLKGPALAHSVYPNPMWRGFGDIDLLLPAARWYQGLALLEASGARRPVPEIGAEFDVRFGKDATLFSASGWEIDLHRRLVVGPYGLWAKSAEIFANGTKSISLGGKAIAVLELEEAFLHACFNAALADDPPRLVALRDVAQIAFTEALDVERVVDTAARWKASEVVANALRLSEKSLRVRLSDTEIGARFRGMRPRAWHCALMTTYRGPGRGYTSQLAGVVAVRGVRNKAAYLAALARPQDSYLRARGLSPSGFLAHAGRRVWNHR